MNIKTLRQRAEDLIFENGGDICAVYASVWNQTLDKHTEQKLFELKQELEKMMAEDAMNEFNWELTKSGKWKHLTSENSLQKVDLKLA